MSDELMTTRELQDFLRVDRTTIYNMLSEGRLPGFKVGGQWRFSRREIEIWLGEQQAEVEKAPVYPSPDALPLNYVQSIQAIFAGAMEVGSLVTQLDGVPLTKVSNSCDFCDLILSTPQGFSRCSASWEALASQKERKPRLFRCHAGLLYARSRIELGNDLAVARNGMRELAEACGIEPAKLENALSSVASLSTGRAEQLVALLGQMGETLSGIGRERLLLLRKLRHIAEITGTI
jgi:excisionase family DNA binding protein